MTIQELRSRTGEEIGVSPWHTVTQEQIDRFAEVTGDNQWIHIDAERARRESPYGTPIAHGFLTVSMLSGMAQEAVKITDVSKMRINYGFNRLRCHRRGPGRKPYSRALHAQFVEGRGRRSGDRLGSLGRGGRPR
jgi:acyl dehydratase